MRDPSLNLPVNIGLRRALKCGLMMLFMGYISFIPTGPYPIKLWGAKLDHLFAFGTALFAFVLFRFRWPRALRPVYAGVAMLLAVAFITTMSSSDLDISLRAFGVYLGYATIALLVPLLMHNRLVMLRWYLFLAATLTGLLVLYLYFVAHDTGRMRLYTTVDPNMTSIGLLMCVIIFLPMYFEKKKSIIKGLLATPSFIFPAAVVLAAVITLLSRTALLSFLVALVWGFICATLKNTKHFYGKILRKISIVAIAIFLGVVCLRMVNPDLLLNYSQRVTRIYHGSLAPTESQRIIRAENTLDLWSENPKTFLLGRGFFTINPHNELLRMLGGSGLFGFISFLVMLLAFYITCCRSRTASAIYLFGQNALFAYIFIMIQFYGHTKSFWVGLTFLLINYMAQRTPRVKGQFKWVQQPWMAKEGYFVHEHAAGATCSDNPRVFRAWCR